MAFEAFEASTRSKIYVMLAHITVVKISHTAKAGINRAKIPLQRRRHGMSYCFGCGCVILSQQRGLKSWYQDINLPQERNYSADQI